MRLSSYCCFSRVTLSQDCQQWYYHPIAVLSGLYYHRIIILLLFYQGYIITGLSSYCCFIRATLSQDYHPIAVLAGLHYHRIVSSKIIILLLFYQGYIITGLSSYCCFIRVTLSQDCQQWDYHPIAVLSGLHYHRIGSSEIIILLLFYQGYIITGLSAVRLSSYCCFIRATLSQDCQQWHYHPIAVLSGLHYHKNVSSEIIILLLFYQGYIMTRLSAVRLSSYCCFIRTTLSQDCQQWDYHHIAVLSGLHYHRIISSEIIILLLFYQGYIITGLSAVRLSSYCFLAGLYYHRIVLLLLFYQGYIITGLSAVRLSSYCCFNRVTLSKDCQQWDYHPIAVLSGLHYHRIVSSEIIILLLFFQGYIITGLSSYCRFIRVTSSQDYQQWDYPPIAVLSGLHYHRIVCSAIIILLLFYRGYIITGLSAVRLSSYCCFSRVTLSQDYPPINVLAGLYYHRIVLLLLFYQGYIITGLSAVRLSSYCCFIRVTLSQDCQQWDYHPIAVFSGLHYQRIVSSEIIILLLFYQGYIIAGLSAVRLSSYWCFIRVTLSQDCQQWDYHPFAVLSGLHYHRIFSSEIIILLLFYQGYIITGLSAVRLSSYWCFIRVTLSQDCQQWYYHSIAVLAGLHYPGLSAVILSSYCCFIRVTLSQDYIPIAILAGLHYHRIVSSDIIILLLFYQGYIITGLSSYCCFIRVTISQDYPPIAILSGLHHHSIVSSEIIILLLFYQGYIITGLSAVRLSSYCCFIRVTLSQDCQQWDYHPIAVLSGLHYHRIVLLLLFYQGYIITGLSSYCCFIRVTSSQDCQQWNYHPIAVLTGLHYQRIVSSEIIILLLFYQGYIITGLSSYCRFIRVISSQDFQ